MMMTLAGEDYYALVEGVKKVFPHWDWEEVYVAMKIGTDRGVVKGSTFTGTYEDLYTLLVEAQEEKPDWL